MYPDGICEAEGLASCAAAYHMFAENLLMQFRLRALFKLACPLPQTTVLFSQASKPAKGRD